MANFIQKVSNWLLGDYPVATTEVSSGATRKLIQHVMTVDASDNYVSGGGGSGGDGAIVDGVDSLIKATVLDLTSGNPIATAIVDGNGDQITSFGGGTQYTEGDTDASITGTVVMWEDAADTMVAASAAKPLPVATISNALPTGAATSAKQDTGNTSLASIDGKITAVDTGAIAGTVTANAGTNLNTSALALEAGNLASIKAKTDNIPALGQALAAASTPVVLTAAQITTLTPPAAITGFATESTLSTLNGKVTACNTGAVTISAALPAGTNNIGDVDVLTVPTDPFGANADAASATGSISAKLRFIASTGIPVTGTVTVGSHAVTNAGTFAVQPAGSVAHDGAASAVNPVLVGGYASAAAPASVSADTDSVRAWYLRNGAQATVLTAAGALIGGDATNGLDVDVTRVTGTVTVGGDVAHDGADSGSPVKVGGQARTTNPTAVADADRANFITDKLGKQIVVGAIRELKGKQRTQLSSTTTETTIVTAVASTFLDLYGLIIGNTSATACAVTIRDDTAGTVLGVFEVPATDTRGFMLPVDSAVPQAVVNKPWTAQCGTSVAAIEITALYVKNT